MSKPSEATREQLIHTAIRLVARDGVNGTSVRTLNKESGCRNSSVIHYHFGGKQQLIGAAFQKVVGEVIAVASPKLMLLEARMERGESLTPREIMDAAVLPYITLFMVPNHGPLYTRFVARVMSDADDVLRTCILEVFLPFALRCTVLFHYVLPELPPKILGLRLISVVLNLVYAINDVRILTESPFGDVEGDTPMDTIHRFVEHLTLGVAAPTEAVPPDYADALAQYIAAWTGV